MIKYRRVREVGVGGSQDLYITHRIVLDHIERKDQSILSLMAHRHSTGSVAADSIRISNTVRQVVRTLLEAGLIEEVSQ